MTEKEFRIVLNVEFLGIPMMGARATFLQRGPPLLQKMMTACESGMDGVGDITEEGYVLEFIQAASELATHNV